MKLDSSDTRICSAHFEGVKKKYFWQLPSIFPWSKPCKERKLPARRGLDFNDVLSETHLTSSAEFKFEAVEVGAVKTSQRLLSLGHRHWNLTKSYPLNFTVLRPKKLKQIHMGANVKSTKRWRSKLKYSKKKSVP